MGIINQIKYLLICILTVTIISCDSNDCPLNNVVYSTYGFYVNTADGEAKVSVMDTLTVVVAGTDSILINRMYEMSSIELPVSYTSGTDTLVFRFTNKNKETFEDSVFIDKENIPHYESPDCPTAMFHYITGIRTTHTLIENAIVVHPNINYNATENFKIYFYSLH